MPSSSPRNFDFSLSRSPDFPYPLSWKQPLQEKPDSAGFPSDPLHHNNDSKKNNRRIWKTAAHVHCDKQLWSASQDHLIQSSSPSWKGYCYYPILQKRWLRLCKIRQLACEGFHNLEWWWSDLGIQLKWNTDTHSFSESSQKKARHDSSQGAMKHSKKHWKISGN